MAQLYFYYSAMNAGKSTALLQSSYNYQERGMRTVVYTAEIDDRFGAGKVSSRIGLSSPAKLFNQNSSLFDEIRAEQNMMKDNAAGLWKSCFGKIKNGPRRGNASQLSN